MPETQDQQRVVLQNKSQFGGGIEVSDANKLKAFETENAKLKMLLAEQMMGVSTLNEMLGKLLRPSSQGMP